jgi:hypothetical protein
MYPYVPIMLRSQAAVLVLSLATGACSRPLTVSSAERHAIIDSLTRQVKAAYDITKPNVEQRMLSLYPDTGRIVSASGGRLTTSRDTVAMGIKAFWENIGVNMRDPHWIWDQMVFDVLAPNAAVMTATYHVPHRTPTNMPHVIGGAWTAVFQKRGARWYIVQEHLSDQPPMSDSAMAATAPPLSSVPASDATVRRPQSPPAADRRRP